MFSLFNQFNPARLPLPTATAGARTGLRESVNAGSGARRAVHDPAKSGSVAHFSASAELARIGRSLFGRAKAADDPAGDYPPPSDCWPSDLSAYRVRVSEAHEAAARLLNRGGLMIGAQGVAEVEAMLAAVRDGNSFHNRTYRS